MATSTSYQTKIDGLTKQLGDIQAMMTALDTSNYHNIRSIVDYLATNHINDGHHWYYTDTQQIITGPTAESQYQQWVRWLASQDQQMAAYQAQADNIQAQIKAVQDLQKNDPSYTHDLELAQMNFAQKNTEWIIIGVIVVVIVLGIVIVRLIRKKRSAQTETAAAA